METPSVLIEYWKLFLFKSVLSKVIYRFNVQIENPIGIFFWQKWKNSKKHMESHGTLSSQKILEKRTDLDPSHFLILNFNVFFLSYVRKRREAAI